MKVQISKETKSRIKKLRFYRNLEIFNGKLFLYALASFGMFEYNRYGDKFDILNTKIKN